MNKLLSLSLILLILSLSLGCASFGPETGQKTGGLSSLVPSFLKKQAVPATPSSSYTIYHLIGAPTMAIGMFILIARGASNGLGFGLLGAGAVVAFMPLLLRQIDRMLGVVMVIIAIGGAVIGIWYLINFFIKRKSLTQRS